MGKENGREDFEDSARDSAPEKLILQKERKADTSSWIYLKKKKLILSHPLDGLTTTDTMGRR